MEKNKKIAKKILRLMTVMLMMVMSRRTRTATAQTSRRT